MLSGSMNAEKRRARMAAPLSHTEAIEALTEDGLAPDGSVGPRRPQAPPKSLQVPVSVA